MLVAVLLNSTNSCAFCQSMCEAPAFQHKVILSGRLMGQYLCFRKTNKAQLIKSLTAVLEGAWQDVRL